MAANRVGILTDEEKQVLLERYLDIVWCEDVSEVICVRCHRVPIHHYLSNCRHLFCRNCKTVFSDGGQWKCPKCQEYVAQLSDQDWQLEERIYQIRAHCPNRKYGCPYQGQLSTIPGHLTSCEDTRERALPAEFKGITLDTVVKQIENLKVIVEAFHSEVKELREQSESNWTKTQTDAEKLKDRCEINCKQAEEMKTTLDELMTNAKVLTQDIDEQNQHLANVAPVVKDVKELKEKCESSWDQTKTNVDNVTVDLRLLKLDLLEYKEQLANVKPVVKEVKELKEESESKWKHTDTMVSGLTTDVQVLTQGLNEHKEHMAQVVQVLHEREASGSVEMQQLKSQLEQQQSQIEGQTQHLNEENEHSANLEQTLNDREARDEVEMQQLRSQLEQQQSLVEELKEQSRSVEHALKEREASDAVEMQQLRSQLEQQQSMVEELKEQSRSVEHALKEREAKDAVEAQKLQQQHTLMETKITKADRSILKYHIPMLVSFISIAILMLMLGSKQLTNVTATIGEMKTALMDSKVQWETKWKDVEKQLDDFNKHLKGDKNRLLAINGKESKDSVEMQQLSSQVQQQQSLMDTQFKQLIKKLSRVESVVIQINEYEVQLNGMRMVMGQTQMPHDQLHSMSLVYKWDIRDIKMKDGKWDDTRESEVFPLTGYHYGAKAIINTYGLITLQLIDYTQTKRPIDTRSMPKVTWVFVSQSHDTQDNKQLDYTQHSTDAIGTGFIIFERQLKYGKEINIPSSFSTFLRPPYLVSNGMKLRFYIEPPSIARSFFSNDGILLWRMDNYKERKQMQVDGLMSYQESPYFYTSPQGYRAFIGLHLNGTTVYGYLWFVKGEFDSTLTQQFPHRLTVTILNYTDQSKNLVVSQEGREAYETYFDFKPASASSLESGGYVADDSLLIKAVVEPL